MRIRDFMTTDVITVDARTSVLEAQEVMRKKKIKRLPVMKNGKLVGLVTKHMLLEASPSPATSLSIYELNYLISRMRVEEIMIRDPITLTPDTPVEEAIWLGTEKGIGGFPVMDAGRLVGVITESDMTNVISEVLGGKKDALRITVEGLGERLGELREVIGVLDENRAPLLSIITIPRKGRRDVSVIIRLKTADVKKISAALKERGFRVADVT